MANVPDLDVSNVIKRFGEVPAVDRVSFTVPTGSFFSILGPSGCGKTTLMRMIAGFIEPNSGDIRIKGEPTLGIPPNRRPTNMVFQHLALFPMMTVADNIGYGLRRRRVSKADITRRVEAVLDRVGLAGAGPKKVDQLSGGQKQRVAIARCLVLDPALLLLDEPLGALDLKLREQMKVELKQLQAKLGTTFLYITHDQSEALVMSDQVAVMNAGRFEQVGTPQELYYDPQTPFVAGFVGNTNSWTGQVARHAGQQVEVATEDGPVLKAHAVDPVTAGDKVSLFVRPEAIALRRETPPDGAENLVHGSVQNLLFDGGNSMAIVQDTATGHMVTVALPQTGEFAHLSQGEQVSLSWQAGQARCFAAEAPNASRTP